MGRNKRIVLAGILFAVLIISCTRNTLKDIEGNKYKTVTIGTHEWMAENLKTSKFNDGIEIPIVTDNDTWAKLETPAISWYNNDPAQNKNTYGALYNWYAVNSNKLCPSGWHVPTEADWTTLTALLEGSNDAGGMLKEAGTKHWRIPNTDATNETGFTALPGGYRSVKGVFNYIGISGYWWSSTAYNESNILFWNLRFRSGTVYRYRSEKFCGFSVRCVRDAPIRVK